MAYPYLDQELVDYALFEVPLDLYMTQMQPAPPSEAAAVYRSYGGGVHE